MKRQIRKYNLYVIAICIVLSFVVGAVIFKFAFLNSRETVATLQLTFDRLEAGNNPDGSSFNKNQIKAKEILSNVINDLGLDMTVEELERKVFVTPIIPEEMAEQLKITTQNSYSPIYQFVPNEYNVGIYETSISGISTDNAKLIVEAIVEEYRTSFTNRYGNGQIGTLVAIDKEISDYDYLDAIKVIRSRLNLIQSASDNMASEVGYFRGSANNMSFEDISSLAENVGSVDLVRANSLISVYNISKEKEKQVGILEYKIKMLDLDVKKNTDLARMATDMITVVSADTNTDANAIAEMLKSQSFMNSLLSSAAKNTYYSYIVNKAVQANVAAQLANTQKTYYQGEVDKIIGNLYDVTQVNWAVTEVEKEIVNIVGKLNNLYIDYNNLSNEYLKSQVEDTINLTHEAELAGVSKLKVLVLFGFSGCIGLAVGLLVGKKRLQKV